VSNRVVQARAFACRETCPIALVHVDAAWSWHRSRHYRARGPLSNALYTLFHQPPSCSPVPHCHYLCTRDSVSIALWLHVIGDVAFSLLKCAGPVRHCLSNRASCGQVAAPVRARTYSRLVRAWPLPRFAIFAVPPCVPPFPPSSPPPSPDLRSSASAPVAVAGMCCVSRVFSAARPYEVTARLCALPRFGRRIASIRDAVLRPL
jgi:hypothetical protein